MYHDRKEEEEVVRTLYLKSSDLRAVSDLLGQLLRSGDILGSVEEAGTTGAERARCPGGGTAGAQGVEHAPGASAQWLGGELAGLARTILEARQRRSGVLSKAMFGEPAWDMLLWLYAARSDGPRLSVGRLSAMSGSPATTALRWLDYLEKERLVEREPNPTDRRSEFVMLTGKGMSVMEQYLSETLKSLT